MGTQSAFSVKQRMVASSCVFDDNYPSPLVILEFQPTFSDRHNSAMTRRNQKRTITDQSRPNSDARILPRLAKQDRHSDADIGMCACGGVGEELIHGGHNSSPWYASPDVLD